MIKKKHIIFPTEIWMFDNVLLDYQVKNIVEAVYNEKMKNVDIISQTRPDLFKDSVYRPLVDKAVECSIKWPRGERGSLPADAEQFLLIEDALKDIEDIQEELKESRHNATNISRLQKDVDRLLDELEKLKDKVRANGSSH